jgi:hypothetical protein
MATVSSATRSVNSALRSAAAWAALGYVAEKEGDRDQLGDSASFAVDLSITGSIDGQPIDQAISGRLNIGKGCVKASSVAPNVSHVIGCILGKLNEATRAKVLRELPEEYAAGGQSLPAVAVGLVNQADGLLAALRSTKQVASRGPVKCEYALSQAPALGIVG